MRTYALFGAAAVMALATGQACAESTGYLGAAYLNQEVDEFEADGWGAEGALAMEASPGVGVQIHGAVLDDDSDENLVSIDGHLNLRNANRLIGVFGNFASVDDETVWAIGAEGELYMDDMTLAGAVGYETEDDVDLWSIDGEARYFLSENFRLEGELGYETVDSDTFEESAFVVGAGGEYQFASSPFSIFAGYSHLEPDDTDVSVDSFSIGGRFNFGGSLRDRDRKGASLPGLSRRTVSLEGL